MRDEYIENYEDNYSAATNENFETLRQVFLDVAAAESPYAHLNIPIWIDTGESDEDEAVVMVGVLQPRHGVVVQWVAPATEEQVQELRVLMLRVWAARADTGFPRWGDFSRSGVVVERVVA